MKATRTVWTNSTDELAYYAALHPDATVKRVIEAGAFIRRSVRTSCDYFDVDYTEERGLTSSTFVVRGPIMNMLELAVWLDIVQ